MLLSVKLTLSNSSWNFARLAVTNTNSALTVANNNKCCKAKGTTTLVGLGNTVNSNYAIQKLFATVFFTTITTFAALTLALVTARTTIIVTLLSGCLSVLSFFSHLGFLFVVAHSARPP